MGGCIQAELLISRNDVKLQCRSRGLRCNVHRFRAAPPVLMTTWRRRTNKTRKGNSIRTNAVNGAVVAAAADDDGFEVDRFFSFLHSLLQLSIAIFRPAKPNGTLSRSNFFSHRPGAAANANATSARGVIKLIIEIRPHARRKRVGAERRIDRHAGDRICCSCVS